MMSIINSISTYNAKTDSNITNKKMMVDITMIMMMMMMMMIMMMMIVIRRLSIFYDQAPWLWF